MIYGDEYLVSVASGEDLDNISRRQLSKWFRNGERLTHFNSSPDFSPTHDAAASRFDGLLCYRISKDRLIEINDAVVRSPVVRVVGHHSSRGSQIREGQRSQASR